MNLLNVISDLWLKQIKLAKKHKEEKFGKSAKRCWAFMGRSYKQLYLERGDSEESHEFPHVKGPYYKPRINKSAEFVALMMPFVFHKAPTRLVTPDRPLPPAELLAALQTQINPQVYQQDQMRSWLMQWWLNQLCSESGYGLETEMRSLLPEALVKGRGVLWHEMVEGPYGEVPASLFGSVDDLLIDPDCEQLRDAAYVIRRRRQSIWRLAERFGLDRERLKGQYSSYLKRAGENRHPERSASENESSDVCVWYEVWSRMGIGHKFSSAPAEMKEVEQALEDAGPYVYLCVMDGVPHPLNLPPDVAGSPSAASEVRERLRWPVPFYRHRTDPWPLTPVDFYPNARDPWARSPLEPCRSLQAFLDHAYGYLMQRIRTSCRTLIITSEMLEEAIKDAIEKGYDFEMPVAAGKVGEDVPKQVHMLQFPDVREDLWKIIAAVERAFERASGLDPLLYGGQTEKQIRTAEEAGIRREGLISRPQDMADRVEAAMSRAASKEGAMTRLYVGPHIVAPLFGEDWRPSPVGEIGGPLTEAWASLVNTDDEVRAFAELSYTIESGSGRRKNRAKLQSDAQMLSQTLLPQFLQLSMAGLTEPYNALLEWIGDAYEMPPEKIARMMLSPEMIPQPQPESNKET